jgi:antirestriction protein ArdC
MSATTPRGASWNEQQRGGKRQAEAEAALARVLDLFESGDLPERIAETVIRRASSDAPSNAWSLGNQLVQLLNGTADARGFKQWQGVGRKVTKGSKAFYILGPLKRTITERDTESGEDRKRSIITGFTGIPVFRYEDTDGAPLVVPDYAPAAFPPLHEVADRLGVPVSYRPYVAKFLGYYAPGTDAIVLCSYDVRTFFHELAHAAHRRVLQARGKELRGGQVKSQEIVADTCAAVLCELFGFSGYLASTAEYLASYADGASPAKAAMRVLADVQAVLDLILSEADADASERASGDDSTADRRELVAA